MLGSPSQAVSLDGVHRREKSVQTVEVLGEKWFVTAALGVGVLREELRHLFEDVAERRRGAIDE